MEKVDKTFHFGTIEIMAGDTKCFEVLVIGVVDVTHSIAAVLRKRLEPVRR